MNPMVPALSKVATKTDEFVKMSASSTTEKIDILDTSKQIKKKINSAYCVEGNIDDNSLLSLTKHIIFPILDMKRNAFIINRKEKFGGKIVYTSYEELENEFKLKKLHPGDLKMGISYNLNIFLGPVREILNNKKFNNLIKNAY